MDESNPYAPPSDSWTTATDATTNVGTSSPRRLPRSFWTMWISMVMLCLVWALAIRVFGAAADVLLGLPLMGLGLTPFIAFRAKLCESYQHRCMRSSGAVIYWSCFGVCLGLGYAAVGVLVSLSMLASWSLFSLLNTRASMSLGLLTFLIVAMPSLLLYVYLIYLSAKRPRLEEVNETASDPTH